MNAFIHHFSFEFRSGIRYKQLLFMNYIFPLGFYLLMGSIMTGINPSFLENLLPAMMMFSTLSSTLMGIPIALATAQEKGIFRSYKINGVPTVSILVITALTTTLHLLIVAIIISITAPLIFGASWPTNWINFILVFAIANINCASISVLIGVISSSARVSIMWSQLIFVTSVLLGGLMIPNAMLPEIARKFSKLLPATHAMNAFKSLAMGKTTDFSPWGSITVLLLASGLAFGLGIYLFSWDQHNSARRGNPILGFLAFIPFVISVFLF
jgi:ABC-2 type transport system permease protein